MGIQKILSSKSIDHDPVATVASKIQGNVVNWSIPRLEQIHDYVVCLLGIHIHEIFVMESHNLGRIPTATVIGLQSIRDSENKQTCSLVLSPSPFTPIAIATGSATLMLFRTKGISFSQSPVKQLTSKFGPEHDFLFMPGTGNAISSKTSSHGELIYMAIKVNRILRDQYQVEIPRNSLFIVFGTFFPHSQPRPTIVYTSTWRFPFNESGTDDIHQSAKDFQKMGMPPETTVVYAANGQRIETTLSNLIL